VGHRSVPQVTRSFSAHTASNSSLAVARSVRHRSPEQLKCQIARRPAKTNVQWCPGCAAVAAGILTHGLVSLNGRVRIQAPFAALREIQIGGERSPPRAGFQLHARWQCAFEGTKIVRAFERERSLFDAARLAMFVSVESDRLGLGGSGAVELHAGHIHLRNEPGLARRNDEIIRSGARACLRRDSAAPRAGILVPQHGRRAGQRAACDQRQNGDGAE